MFIHYIPTNIYEIFHMRVFHYSEAFLVVKLVEPQKLENSRASHFRSFPPFSVIFSGGSNILAATQSALDYTGGNESREFIKTFRDTSWARKLVLCGVSRLLNQVILLFTHLFTVVNDSRKALIWSCSCLVNLQKMVQWQYNLRADKLCTKNKFKNSILSPKSPYSLKLGCEPSWSVSLETRVMVFYCLWQSSARVWISYLAIQTCSLSHKIT